MRNFWEKDVGCSKQQYQPHCAFFKTTMAFYIFRRWAFVAFALFLSSSYLLIHADKYTFSVYNDGNTNYKTNVTIGSPLQTFSLLFDTGSANLWVPCLNCTGDGCDSSDVPKFNCSASSTCTETDTSFEIGYGTGNAGGHIDNDTVCFGDGSNSDYCTDNTQGFACVTTDPNSGLGGIMGVSRGPASVDNVPQPLFQIFDKSTCTKKMIAFYFTFVPFPEEITKPKDGSDVTICGYNPDHVDGDITWIPLYSPDTINAWTIEIESISFMGKTLISSSKNQSVVDTGTTYMGLPSDVYEQFTDLAGINSTEFNCSLTEDFPSLFFNINGASFELPVEYWIWHLDNVNANCYLVISDNSENGYDLGLTFMHRFYSIFDTDNEQIGFAVAKNVSEATTTTTTASKTTRPNCKSVYQ